MSDRVVLLRGHLDVLLAMRVELRAIGAPAARVERHRATIARVRAELAQATAAANSAIPPMRSTPGGT